MQQLTTLSAPPQRRNPSLRALGRARKFAGVSLTGTAVSYVLIFAFLRAGVSPVAANAGSVILVTPLSLLLSVCFVWTGSRGRWTNYLPAFFAANFSGLILSSVTVALVATRSDSALAVSAANFSAWGLCWAAKFAVLDRRMTAKSGGFDADGR